MFNFQGPLSSLETTFSILSIKKLNGDNKDLLIVSLTDIDPEFKEIEYLFSESDRLKFGIQKEDGKLVKSSILSSNIKKYGKEKDFSEETQSNFKKVLDYIIEVINN